MLEKMRRQFDFAISLPSDSRCAMASFCREHVARPIYQYQQEHRTVMSHVQQTQEINARQYNELKQLLVDQRHTSIHPVTPHKQNWVSRNTAQLSVVTPAQSTLADGCSPRKRKPPVTQMAAISHEYKRRELAGESAVSEPIELLCDKGLYTFDDYWHMYKSKWRPLEESTHGMWRQDFVCDHDGKKKRGRSAWWTQRVGMFKVVEQYISSCGLTEEEAVAKATAIFNGARSHSDKKPGIKALNTAFKREMAALGIKATGRPKKQQTYFKHTYRKRKPTKGETQQSPDAFAQAFQMDTPALQTYYDQAPFDMQAFDSPDFRYDLEETPIEMINDVHLGPNRTHDDGTMYRHLPPLEARRLNEGHLGAHGRQQVMQRLNEQWPNHSPI